ncbi:DNA repair protein RecN [Ferriphaselus sp. R-1]|uniref:DNA repair protein RecN n=1 Tax=Ferriphaselus sp. R-1 TaxID=1485544 RepID=UPI00055886A4|nr:DNA repair protein RecN [Ferriphaselus sp. R-1]
MLRYLSIRDFVIVAQLELDFTGGFTALSGETGAGKSILLDALSLALGERGDGGMVRSGCERAEISAEFDIAGLPGLQLWLEQQELPGDDGVCLLRRVLDAGGRSRGFINGRSATLQQMREASEWLLDIHGQHAHQSLLRPDAQRDLLDAYAGARGLAEQVSGAYKTWQMLEQRCRELSQNAEAMAAERELLSFQAQELESLDFSIAGWQETQAEYARLSHAASLLETAEFGLDVLGESEVACLPQLNALIARIETGIEVDPALGETLQLLDSARAELQEAVYALRQYQRRLELDPQRQRTLERTIQTVVDAARKYRVTPEELPQAQARVAARLAELGGDADLDALQRQAAQAYQSYLGVAQRLSGERRAAADQLSREITAAMQTLAMQGGSFVVSLATLAEGNRHGLESIEFQVAANPGMPVRALAKTASGGELARISLAMQVALSEVAQVPTLIFDEVDSGIGGRVAEIVGKLLKRLGQRHQVLCVTHLPQVAASADAQWQVSKTTRDGSTFSDISVLSPAQRVDEVARMLGGITLTETTRKHAAEMLGHTLAD